ncbi:metalloprotease ybeY [[Leptolyngbya] sp. PCC 7376]|uniref:rRNA maturation RNase YbeY n=1 Tax=[Leptolyngbya] sp. PCC 7376 TaxID=111781 RepID=UPI00029EFBFD|nr:rRNA maturation RNase YbeY [[Leptolyngbya] sp. PCC 7376]AFY38849.1 metalloprotease ybeY [[Leptolyngbya] sp. PCC 7376]
MDNDIFVEMTLAETLPELAIAQWQTWLNAWLQDLAETLPKAVGYELTLRFTDDAEIHQLNTQYRQKDQPTDVLSFAALEDDLGMPLPDSEPIYLGDIIVSVDTAQKQAIARNHSLQTELGWLASHGLLHLLGWDHPDDQSLEKMLDRQALLLRRVQLIP